MEAKKWYLSRTVWLNILIVAGGIAEFIGGLPAGASATTIAVGIIGILIRFLTNQPISK